jgi:hypothetical protein
MSSARRTRTRVIAFGVIGIFLLSSVALLAVAASLKQSPPQLVQSGAFGPYSTSRGSSEASDIHATVTNAALAFRVRIDDSSASQVLFESARVGGLEVALSPFSSQGRTLLILVWTAQGAVDSYPLIHNPRAGSAFDIRITLYASELSATVNGATVLSRHFPPGSFTPVFNGMVIGANCDVVEPFQGTISAFTIHYVEYTPSRIRSEALDGIAALLFAVAFLVALALLEATRNLHRRARLPARRLHDRSLYLKFGLLVLALLVFNIALGWVLQNYFGENVIQNISFRASDPSWLPFGVHVAHLAPALGIHYFSDFGAYVGYARTTVSPYSSQGNFPALYGPTSIVFVKVLDFIFGWPSEVFVYLGLSLALMLWALIKITGITLESWVMCGVILFSGSVLESLDRGNFALLVAALMAFACGAMLTGRSRTLIVTLSLAITIKVYAAVLILVLLRNREWRLVGKIAAATAAIYAVCFALVPGGYGENVMGFLRTDLQFANPSTVPTGGSTPITDAVSLPAIVFKFLALTGGQAHAVATFSHLSNLVVQLPGVLVALLCLLLVWLARDWIGLVAALAIPVLAPELAYPYLELDFVIGACLVVSYLAHTRRDARLMPHTDYPVRKLTNAALWGRRSLLLAATLMVVGDAPWIFRIGHTPSFETGAFLIIGPILDLLSLLCLLAALVLHRRERRTAPAVVEGA